MFKVINIFKVSDNKHLFLECESDIKNYEGFVYDDKGNKMFINAIIGNEEGRNPVYVTEIKDFINIGKVFYIKNT